MDGMEKEIRKQAKQMGAPAEHIEKIVAHWKQREVRAAFQREWPNYADYPLAPAAYTYLHQFWIDA